MKKYAIVLAFLLSLISSIILFSQTLPHTINYQGVLKDASGVVVPNGDYNIKFTIYDNDAEIWTETKSITVNDGIVNAQLGSVTPINLPFDNEYYLGIRIGTENELIPRLKLSSVPYSYMSMNVPDGSITAQELNQMGATNGQVLKWNGTNWIPSGDEIGGGEIVLPYSGIISTNNSGFLITNNGTGNAIKGVVTNLGQTALIGEAINQGIVGIATSLTGLAYGVQGVSESSSGSGVTGYCTSDTGNTIGVKGLTESNKGVGVQGYSYSPSGWTEGVHGETFSPDGYGVNGVGFIGVHGVSDYSPGFGLYGRAKSQTGITTGAVGESSSNEGRGVLGNANSWDGKTYGVYGISYSTEGTGVYGVAYRNTGENFGVMGETTSPTGFSGYFKGGKFFVSGNVGIGTTLPEYRLVVVAPGTTSTGIGAFRNSNGENKVILRQNSNGSGAVNIYKGDNTVALSLVGDGYSYFNGGRVGIGTDTPTQMLHIVGNAYKTEGGTAWATSSDIRLKDVLGDYEKGLNEIASLQPVRYNYKKDNSRKIDSSTEQVGFVAQDVQKIFPEAVTEAEDGYLDFNIHSINIALVNAVKELKAENDELKARLEKIEKYLNTMSMK